MKKLTLALAASVLAINSAVAHISTGFYAGMVGGYGATTGKFTVVRQSGSTDVGAGAASLGLLIGYGWVTNCVYWGGEAGYVFENTRINETLGQTTNLDAVRLKRTGYTNLAIRGGYLFNPNTMMFIRLGGNFSNWKMYDGLWAFTASTSGRGSKNRFTFIPGVGMETSVQKQVYVRIEYLYEFGPGISTSNPSVAGASSQMGTLRSQTGRVGLAYKF